MSESLKFPWSQYDSSMTLEQWNDFVDDINSKYPNTNALKKAGLNLKQLQLYLLSWHPEFSLELMEDVCVYRRDRKGVMEYKGLCLMVHFNNCPEAFPFPDGRNPDAPVPPEVIDFADNMTNY
jgi:hypothetical protein